MNKPEEGGRKARGRACKNVRRDARRRFEAKDVARKGVILRIHLFLLNGRGGEWAGGQTRRGKEG